MGGGGGERGSVGIFFFFATMLLHPWFLLIWYATWPCSEKVQFDLLTPPPKSIRGSGTGLRSKVTFDMFLFYCTSVRICYHVAAFPIPFDMQHDHVLKKKLNFDSKGQRRVSAGITFANMLLHPWFPLIIPRRSRRVRYFASSVCPSVHSLRSSTLFVCPEPYLSTYRSDLILSWYKW